MAGCEDASGPGGRPTRMPVMELLASEFDLSNSLITKGLTCTGPGKVDPLPPSERADDEQQSLAQPRVTGAGSTADLPPTHSRAFSCVRWGRKGSPGTLIPGRWGHAFSGHVGTSLMPDGRQEVPSREIRGGDEFFLREMTMPEHGWLLQRDRVPPSRESHPHPSRCRSKPL